MQSFCCKIYLKDIQEARVTPRLRSILTRATSCACRQTKLSCVQPTRSLDFMLAAPTTAEYLAKLKACQVRYRLLAPPLS